MKGVHHPLSDQSSTVRAEIVEVGPQFNPSDQQDVGAPKTGSFNWLRAGALAALLVAGVALVPGTQPTPSATTVDLTLPQPAVATSTIQVAPRAVSVVGDETFSLIPVADLDGFANIAGPVEFQARHWVVAGGGPSRTNTATILSSTDGASWSVETEFVGLEPNLTVWDMMVFRSNIVVLGISSAAHPIAQQDFAQRLVAWTSTDGRTWTRQSLPDMDTVAYWDVRAVAGNEYLMVAAGVYEAYGDLAYPAIPAEFQPALAAGQLFATWKRRPEALTVTVLAPPGFEIFSTEVPVASARLFSPTRVLWTDDLTSWDVIDPSVAGSWGLAWSDDVGFVRQGEDGGTLTSTDGQSWERNLNLPSGNYLSTKSGLVGLVNDTGAYVDLLLLEDGQKTRIGLPNEMFLANGWPWIEAGPSGLIAAVTRYEIEVNTEPVVVSGDLVLTWTNQGQLMVIQDNEETARIQLGGSVPPPATYDPATGSLAIDLGEGSETLTIPLEDLAPFWSRSPQSARTEFYQSSDGLLWSKGETAVFTDSVSLIGGIVDGFLIGVGTNAVEASTEQAMTVFRTGPID